LIASYEPPVGTTSRLYACIFGTQLSPEHFTARFKFSRSRFAMQSIVNFRKIMETDGGNDGIFISTGVRYNRSTTL
jgi:hypothetical protein